MSESDRYLREKFAKYKVFIFLFEIIYLSTFLLLVPCIFLSFDFIT